MTQTDIPLLFSADAEESLCGGIIIREEIPDEIKLYGLKPGDFYIIRNRWVWMAAISLGKYDIKTLWEELERTKGKKDLNGFGGPARLTTLVYRCDNSYDIEKDARVIKELSERRFALRIANRLAQVIYALDEPFNLDDIVTKLYKSRVQTE
jgi:replicative DNA helicase